MKDQELHKQNIKNIRGIFGDFGKLTKQLEAEIAKMNPKIMREITTSLNEMKKAMAKQDVDAYKEAGQRMIKSIENGS